MCAVDKSERNHPVGIDPQRGVAQYNQPFIESANMHHADGSDDTAALQLGGGAVHEGDFLAAGQRLGRRWRWCVNLGGKNSAVRKAVFKIDDIHVAAGKQGKHEADCRHHETCFPGVGITTHGHPH